jgi:hypothetical protein
MVLNKEFTIPRGRNFTELKYIIRDNVLNMARFSKARKTIRNKSIKYLLDLLYDIVYLYRLDKLNLIGKVNYL